ncbi:MULTISPECIES: bacteriocin immunity protein [unclassified Pseudomonas]|uniref:bacteriocin immunity protein n=2 Tax=unclassified Pseudomonas TaxID=196821 RepID=UPI002B233D79|nr:MULTISPECIES: bacteriocin immunity protein [unclassified Pseudomonas]
MLKQKVDMPSCYSISTKLLPHPAGSDLLYYPQPGADESPEGVVQEIQTWCLANGVPGLKSAF